MLPTLILLFAWASYLGNLYANRQLLNSEARSCAWRIAAHGCSETPRDCEAQETKHELDESMKNRIAQAENFNSTRDEAESGEGDSAKSSSTAEAIGDQIESMLMDRIEIAPSRQLERPKYLGGESVTLKSSFSLPCNSKPNVGDSMLGEMFGDYQQ